MREANRKQAIVPEGSIALDPVGTAPGLVVPADDSVVVVLPGPPRELQPMWPAAVETAPVAAVLERATPLRGYTLRMFGIPESEIAKSLREIEDEGVALPEVEITTCLRRGEIEIDVRYRDHAAETAEAVRAGLRERHPRHLFSLDGETIDSQVATLCWRATGSAWPSPAAAACWRRGSPTCPAPRPTWPAASSPTRTRPRRTCSASTRR